MRFRSIFVSVATVGLMVGPAFAHGVLSNVAGAKAECTITGTAADDGLNGTTPRGRHLRQGGTRRRAGLRGKRPRPAWAGRRSGRGRRRIGHGPRPGR